MATGGALNLVGRKLGKYLVESELGRGGMGVVYRAQQTNLDRIVAIKVLAPSLIGDPDGVMRFQREARAIARLNHHGIIQVFDIEEAEDLFFLVMEYVEGEGLDTFLAKNKISQGRILRIVSDIADALHFAHEKGVVHRDIKPANVMLTKDGRVKVADFGLAHFLDSAGGGQTKTGMVLGSPSYMSPEQVQGQRVDRRSDIYSLGVVLFRMLTGRVPFVAESSHALLFKHVQEQPPDPRELNPEITPEVRRLVLKALAKKTTDRFQTMAEFRQACNALIGEADQEVSSSPPAERGPFDEPEDSKPTSVLREAGARAATQVGPTAIYDMPTERTAAPASLTSATVVGARPQAASGSAPVPVPEKKGVPVAGIAAGAAVVAALAALIAVFKLGGKADNPPIANPQPTPAVATVSTATTNPVSTGTPPSDPTPAAVAGDLGGPAPTATPAPVEQPTEVVRIVVATPTPGKPVKTADSGLGQVAATRTPITVNIPFDDGPVEYCVRALSATQVSLVSTRDFSPAFNTEDGAQKKAIPPDASDFKLVASIKPEKPKEGETFLFKVEFVNEAGRGITIATVEESSAGVEVYKEVKNVSVPFTLEEGASMPVYGTSTSLEGRAQFRKEVRLTTKGGVRWARSFSVRSCSAVN
ncbi:MAG: protein kinase [Acidobacteria bacterium]|nr:protein kinase [Acidobacteriota bacterium]